MRIGHRQSKILKLVYRQPTERDDIYNLVFNSPVKDKTFSSRVAKSLIRLKKHGLIDYGRNSKVRITEKGAKKAEMLLGRELRKE